MDKSSTSYGSGSYDRDSTSFKDTAKKFEDHLGSDRFKSDEFGKGTGMDEKT